MFVLLVILSFVTFTIGLPISFLISAFMSFVDKKHTFGVVASFLSALIVHIAISLFIGFYLLFVLPWGMGVPIAQNRPVDWIFWKIWLLTVTVYLVFGWFCCSVIRQKLILPYQIISDMNMRIVSASERLKNWINEK